MDSAQCPKTQGSPACIHQNPLPSAPPQHRRARRRHDHREAIESSIHVVTHRIRQIQHLPRHDCTPRLLSSICSNPTCFAVDARRTQELQDRATATTQRLEETTTFPAKVCKPRSLCFKPQAKNHRRKLTWQFVDPVRQPQLDVAKAQRPTIGHQTRWVQEWKPPLLGFGRRTFFKTARIQDIYLLC